MSHDLHVKELWSHDHHVLTLTTHHMSITSPLQNTCSGKERQMNRAEVTCYDDHCTAIQGGQPVRMCRDCHLTQHANVRDQSHIYQGRSDTAPPAKNEHQYILFSLPLTPSAFSLSPLHLLSLFFLSLSLLSLPPSSLSNLLQSVPLIHGHLTTQ